MSSCKSNYDIQINNNSVAIVGWQEGMAGQIHSWLENIGRYHIACFVNISDKHIYNNSELFSNNGIYLPSGPGQKISSIKESIKTIQNIVL